MLRNRKEVTEKKLRGVNRAADPTKVKLGTFIETANFVPAKRWKMKKKRGVEELATPPVTLVVNPCIVGICPEQAPAAQVLEVVCCYNSNGFGDLSTNNNGGLSHISADGSFWHIATENTGFTSGPYPVATPTQTWYVLQPVAPESTENCDLEEVPAVELPTQTANFSSTQTPQGGDCGTSDEKSYLIDLINISPTLSGVGNNSGAKTYFGENSGVTYMNSSANKGFGQTWTKFGDYFYAMIYGFASSDKEFGRWLVDAPLGTYEDTTVPMETMLPDWDDSVTDFTSVQWLEANEDFIYILAYAQFDNGSLGAFKRRLYQINRSDMTYIQHWELDGTEFEDCWAFSIFNDDLIFMIQGGGGVGWKIGYFLTGDESMVVIDTVTTQCTDPGNGIGQVGNSGFLV